MPILFVGHGSPMNAIEDNEFTKNFVKMTKGIDKPKAIVCISAHWFTDGTKVTATENPKTIHDFYGFPKELYQIEYPALGDVNLAKKIKNLLSPIKVALDNDWGLDHGTWSVLRHMYPGADIPVVQISIDYNKDASYHFDLVKKLASLRSEGILIVGSGNIVHNLGMVDFNNIETHDYGYEWAKRIKKIINEKIIKGDYDFILKYDKQDDDFHLAVPTPEHFLPLIYILGLKQENEEVEFFNDVLVGGSLSMTGLKIGN
ncbi:4,5-DOPA dioxygenase extradiol [Candidatus Nomurabacteria bacterium]|nr:4,5-DOPA dioxygenase extradiol [Candidatus Nomurabacteria bacterium]